jgi:hypothetical protein
VLLTIPNSTPLNVYHVCAMADSPNRVVEADELNNTMCSPTQITVTP